MTGLACRRRERAQRVDRRITSLYADALALVPGAAGRTSVVAVGGYGRNEMSPHSDVDVVLLHTPDLPAALLERVAERLWYPLWDDGARLDHAVRDIPTMRRVAAEDWKAALGLLDARHVAGETALTADLRTAVLADWRSSAARRLPQLRTAWAQRADRAGDLAHAAVPDLKESRGGLRDGVLLRALVATWLVDVPHEQAEEHRAALLDLRDALHTVAGRGGDRWVPELVPDVARLLGTDAETLGLHLRGLGRRTAQLVDLTWRRLDQAVARPRRRAGGAGSRRPRLERIGSGLARVGRELVLDGDVRPDEDPFLGVRAAGEAAERGLLLAPSTARRLATVAPVLPEPWPAPARRDLVRLLAAGPGLVPVWDEVDHAGLVDQWLPEWAGIRLRTSESAVHRFTVDRHCIQTCVEASRLLRDVARPDLLVVAALLHDIGKGVAVAADRPDHCQLGAPTADKIARRLGFDDASATTIGFLVRYHLLLPETAVRRDLDDPATAEAVAAVLGDRERLSLLHALTESDARSAGPLAWSTWRAGLIRTLVASAGAALPDGQGRSDGPVLASEPMSVPVPAWAAGIAANSYRMRVHDFDHGSQVVVAGRDRVGLAADIAGTFAVAGLAVRAARVTTRDGMAVSRWEIEATGVDVTRLRLRLDRILDGSTDLRARLLPALEPSAGSAAPAAARVRVLPDASPTATVLEVRAADRTGLLWRVLQVLADSGADVRSAHLETLGPQAQDVVYVTDRNGRPFDEHHAERLAGTLRRALAVRASERRG